MYKLPENGGVPSKHVGINKRLYCCTSAGFVYELLHIVCTLPVATIVMVSLPCVFFAVLRTAYTNVSKRYLLS